MVLTMTDFPPNLEDGESWLPSDIMHEISFTNTKPHPTFTDNAASGPAAHAFAEPNRSAARSLHTVSPYFEICDYSTPYNFWNGGVQVVPGSITLYCPITPSQNQGFENLGGMVLPRQQNCPWPVQVNRHHEVYGFAGKSGGTGVFLPGETGSIRKSKEAAGTGVFINQHVSVTSRKKNKSVKNGQGDDKKHAIKEESQVPNGLRLS